MTFHELFSQFILSILKNDSKITHVELIGGVRILRFVQSNKSHESQNEENYAAAGSSCLGFEDITEVLLDNNRVIQH